MSDQIHIGKVTLPLVDYAVGASAVLGIRDSGKTVTSKGLAEQLLDNNVPIIVFDAVGKWRWMKVAADHSRGKAYKVVVAGGREPDLPLTPHSVPEIVRAALKERIPLVIDLYSKNMSKADWRKIVQTAIHIIHYENEGGAVHVFLEEAAEFVPQKVYDGETYAEVEKLVRMGGNASVGITLINQRSQEVNKAVLDNCSTALVLGCQVGSNAIQAVERWIERLDPDTAKAVTTSLPKLQSGEAWVWTRKSLTEPTREKMPMCRSFHPDRRTPETVTVANSPRVTDVAQFVTRMATTIPKAIEEAKANDPAELRKQLGVLKTELERAKRHQPAPAPEPQKIPILTDFDRTILTGIKKTFDEIHSALGDTEKLSRVLDKILLNTAEKIAVPQRSTTPRVVVGTVRVNRQTGETNGEALGKCETAILSVLAQHGPCPIGKLALLAGYCQSGSFKNSLSSLRTAGYINGENGGMMEITQEGSDQGPFPVVETGVGYWLNFPQFGQCERAIIEALYDESAVHGLDIDTLCRKAGYETPASGSFKNSLSALRTAGVLVGRNSELMKLNENILA